MIHYTKIEQSKKLLELGLSPESADMLWEQHNSETPYVTIKPYNTIGKSIGAHILPCWSLGALLSLMQRPYSLQKTDENKFFLIYDDEYGTTDCFTPVGAAFEMVCLLLENGYIESKKV